MRQFVSHAQSVVPRLDDKSFGGSYPNSAGSDSIARIGTYSLDIRPSHSTTAVLIEV